MIRLLKNNKKYFPTEVVGLPKSYDLQILFNNEPLAVTYKIGSTDKKSRSGLLVFKKEDYFKLNIVAKVKIKLIILIKNKFYKIIKYN